MKYELNEGQTIFTNLNYKDLSDEGIYNNVQRIFDLYKKNKIAGA
jgi:hypothetical protein